MNTDCETIQTQWRETTIEITWKPEWSRIGEGLTFAHLEIRSVNPPKAPLPITATGYRSHFTDRADVMHYGDPEAYVMAWLDDAARSLKWREAEMSRRQLALF